MDKKVIIGLTGGIGSGKSLIMNLFEHLNYPTYNSDIEAKNIYKNQQVKQEVMALFGDKVYTQNKLNRAYLGQLVFSNKKALDQLNKIIHPRVAEHFEQWISEQDSPVVVKEAAILIESGSYKNCDGIITVSATADIRIKRVMSRDRISAKEVKARMDKQLSDAERETYADWIIRNDGSTSVIKQAMDVHSDIQTQYCN